MSGLVAGFEGKAATDVHATLCALVTTHAATHAAWADYASVLLDPETEAFFEARLPNASVAKAGESDSSQQPSKKKRQHSEGGDGDADAAVVCEHCGGPGYPVPQISLRVACMDGSTLHVTVPQRGAVREVKRVVGQVCVCVDGDFVQREP
jgi:hypothetical protein